MNSLNSLQIDIHIDFKCIGNYQYININVIYIILLYIILKYTLEFIY